MVIADQFTKYFGKYGEITDSVIMKDRQTGRPRGFGFITYADPSVVDTVIAETHVINGKQVGGNNLLAFPYWKEFIVFIFILVCVMFFLDAMKNEEKRKANWVIYISLYK